LASAVAAEQGVAALLACAVAAFAALAVFLASAVSTTLAVLLASAAVTAALLRGITTAFATLLSRADPKHTVEQFETVALLGTQGNAQDHCP
jgi:hypothetical protein